MYDIYGNPIQHPQAMSGTYLGYYDPLSALQALQAQGALGGGLGALQAQRGLGDYLWGTRPLSEEEINKLHWNPKYPPTTAETYGEFGTAAQTDYDNRMLGRERNTKDMFQVRRFIEDQNNKERRAAYDKWVERRDLWTEEK